MTRWLNARWQAFLASFDPEKASLASSPSLAFVSTMTLIAVYVIVAEVPVLSRMAQPRFTLTACVLAVLGGICTQTAFRTRCRGPIGSVATLLDNGFYAMSLSVAAIGTSGGTSIGFAVVEALMIIGLPSNFYGFSLLMLSVLCGPTLLLLLWHQPDIAVTLVLVSISVIAAIMMVNTHKRNELVAGAKRLEQALGATDQMLDVAMQRALTTTLLNLGNFLHELRNVQTAVRMNLEFLDRDQLGADQSAAVDDALQAARSEQTLLEETLEELRRQAQPREGTILVVNEVLERTLRGRVSGLSIDHRSNAPRFEVHGEPAHLATVLRNLLRNARQAGASSVNVRLELEATARTVLIRVTDDGPGIPQERLGQLFQPFVTAGKPTGTGLGLYLCRRYIELMHGEISVSNQVGGGASFSIRLPGSIAPKVEPSAAAAGLKQLIARTE